MKISRQFTDTQLILHADPGPDDIEFQATRKGKLSRKAVEFSLPEAFEPDRTHPDLIALIALLVFGPFTARNIEFDWRISAEFAEAVLTSFKRRAGPSDPQIESRKAKPEYRPALAFSGGVDSFAALAVMPEDTVPVFCHRIVPDGHRAGLYRADAALRACEDLKKTHDVQIVCTTMEFARDPVGFSVDWTNGCGAVLLADHLGLDSIAFGLIMESAYFIGHPKYSDLESRSIYAAWAPIFASAGLPMYMPVAGLSEVVTSKIAIRHEERWHAESCVRGKVEEPCLKCFKCFRKTILDHRIRGRALDSSHFDIALTSREVKSKLLTVPIHHENVLAYSLFGLTAESNPVLDALRQKTISLQEYGRDLLFLERHYPRSIRLIPEKYREATVERIHGFAQPATLEDIETIECWDTQHLTETDRYKEGHSTLENILG